MAIDPIVLAVINSGLEQVASEIHSALVRTAFSAVIAEAEDVAGGIYDAQTGEVIAQGERSMPTFVNVMQDAVQSVLRSQKQFCPGDVFILNDPYAGGTHLPDVKVVAPYYYRGELSFFLANTGHWLDIGGGAGGGFLASATEMYQEGIRMPPLKLVSKGELNEPLVQLLLANIRVPKQRLGDLQAQRASLYAGAQLLTDVIDRHGRNTVMEAVKELKRRATQVMRAHIREVPDGVYKAEEFMDSDGVEDRPVRLALTMTVKDDNINFDFSESDPPVAGPINSPISATRSGVLIALKHTFPDVPVNSGAFEPVHFQIPNTTFLAAEFPKPVSGCAAEVGQRICDVVFACLAQAVPDRVNAGNFSTVNNVGLNGIDQHYGRYVMYTYSGGGYGGSVQSDGLTFGCSLVGTSLIPSIEIYEQRYPVRIRRFAIREGSAGAGWHRGGMGAVYEVELLSGTAEATLMGDRGRFAPRGVAGGKAGASNRVIWHRVGGDYQPPHLTKGSGIHLEPGDYYTMETPGGGGYGDPFQRDPALVLRDVERGYYTAETARSDYGVALKMREGLCTLEEEATRRLRKQRRVA